MVSAGLAAKARKGFVWSQRADLWKPAVGFKLPSAIEAKDLKSDYRGVGRVSFRSWKWSQAGWKAFPKCLVLSRR